MRYVPETVSSALVTLDVAIASTRDALIAAADLDSRSFPAVLGHGSAASNRFSLKSAATPALVGVKIGSYWPENEAIGLTRHGSCILLFDQQIGRIGAIVEASAANALRTAAANSLAVEHLARRDAACLAIFGAGRQAWFECEAVMARRPIEEILIVNRDTARAQSFAERLAAMGKRVSASTAENACSRADIIVTATAARAPLFDAAWVRPGTHVSCMGADAAGKQEAPPALLEKAQLFCDLAEQSLLIGEFQHIAPAVRQGNVAPPTALGRVLAGQGPGRIDPSAITVFDSSGLALQDLHLAERILDLAARSGQIVTL